MSAQPVRRTRNARRSLPVGDAAVRLLLPVILVLAVLGGVVPAWGDGSAPPQIVPGGGIGGTPAPLVRAFGHPRRFVLDPGMAVLLWPNGLVARIAASRNYEIITYLAVVAPQTAIPPYAFLTALTPSN